MHELGAVELAVGLAALLIGGVGGYAAGRRAPGGSGAAGTSADNPAGGDLVPGQLPESAAATAGRDWAAAERGRPWASPGPAPRRTSSGETPDDAHRGASKIRPATGDGGRAVAERDTLIAACADLADRLRDRQPALYAALARDLAAAGVELQAPDGQRFDAGCQNAVGTEPAASPEQDLLVAETTRLGYRQHGIQVRVPDVTVYRWKES